VTWLNSRPKASADFVSGSATTAVAGEHSPKILICHVTFVYFGTKIGVFINFAFVNWNAGTTYNFGANINYKSSGCTSGASGYVSEVIMLFVLRNLR
jgi:hypothetical protein